MLVFISCRSGGELMAQKTQQRVRPEELVFEFSEKHGGCYEAWLDEYFGVAVLPPRKERTRRGPNFLDFLVVSLGVKPSTLVSFWHNGDLILGPHPLGELAKMRSGGVNPFGPLRWPAEIA